MRMKEEREKAGLKLNIQKAKIMSLVPSLLGKQIGENGNNDRLFSQAPKSLQTVATDMKLKDAYSLEGKL